VPSDDSATPEAKPAGSEAFVSFATGDTDERQARGEETWKTYTAASLLPTLPAATRTVAPSEEIARPAGFVRAVRGRLSLAAGRRVELHEPSEGARNTKTARSPATTATRPSAESAPRG
jgi:hypothetical protein